MTNFNELNKIWAEKMANCPQLTKKQAFIESFNELELDDDVLYRGAIAGLTIEERRQQKKKRYKK